MLRGDLGAGRRRPRSPSGAAALRGSSGCRSAGRCSRCSPRPPPTSAEALEQARRGRGRVEARRRPRPGAPATATTSRVFTRSLDDITDRVPEVVEAALALPVRDVVLDGEAIALRAGRPAAAVPGDRQPRRPPGRRRRRRAAAPLTPFVFDVLHLDGEDLLDLPRRERAAVLAARRARAAARSRASVTADAPAAARRSRRRARARPRGRRGQGARRARTRPAGAAPAGSRSSRVHTLDLVVLAAEWGHGRRRGWLSNLHLGARDPATAAS